MRPVSRPLRALRGGLVVAAVAAAWRVPTIERRFAASLAAGQAAGGEWLAVAALERPVAASVHAAVVATDPPLELEPPRSNPTAAASGRVARRTAAPPPRRLRTDDGEPLRQVAGAAGVAAPRAGDALPALAATTVDPGDGAGPLATAAYARLAAGDRRAAVRLFDAALLLGDPRAAAWRRQRNALTRRWSATAYSILRADGGATPVTPVLGGGQSGVGLAFTPDPLAARPLALTVRGSVAHGDAGRSGFAAVGVAWRPLPGVTVAAERLIAVGPAAPDDWTIRVAGGRRRTTGRVVATGYGEGGIVGRAVYAAVEGRAAAVLHDRGVAIEPGGGVWASLQRERGRSVDRVDLGPGVVARAGPLAVAFDYRFRVAGNAAPGSGPVVTLSAAF